MQEEEKKAKAQEKFLKDALAAEKASESQRKAPGSARPSSAKAPTESVRLALCFAANPKDKKVVVVKRANTIDEVLKTAKSKLKMKKAGKSATMLDGTVVSATSELDDGTVLVIHLEEQSAADEPSADEATAQSNVDPAGDAAVEAEDVVASLRQAWSRGGGGLMRALGPEAATREQQRLEAALIGSERATSAIQAAREALPAYKHRRSIVEALQVTRHGAIRLCDYASPWRGRQAIDLPTALTSGR